MIFNNKNKILDDKMIFYISILDISTDFDSYPYSLVIFFLVFFFTVQLKADTEVAE